MLDLTQYLAVGVVFFIGAFVQGVVGFGFNVLGVPFLTILAGPKVAVALVSVPSFLNCAALVLRLQRSKTNRVKFELGRVAPLLIIGGLGTLVGVELLVALDPSILLVCLGVLVLIFVATDGRRRNWRPRPEHERVISIVIGFITGLLNGLAGVSGPTLAPYLHTLKLTQVQFIYYLNLIFIFFGTYQLVTYTTAGLYTWELVLTGLSFMPVALFGTWLGGLARDRMSIVWFNRLLLLVLFVTALDLIRRGLHLFQ